MTRVHTRWFGRPITTLTVGALLIGCSGPIASSPSPTLPGSASGRSVEDLATSVSPGETSVTAQPTVAPAEGETSTGAITYSYPYGVVYAYAKSDWTEADREAIREHLEYLQGLGVNTIVQVFSSDLIGTGREADWLILLDEAERTNTRVIARLWPLQDWKDGDFDFEPIRRFLIVVQDHPALAAYLGLHEPLEIYDSDQLRKFYGGLKAVAPALPIAHLLGNMAWFERSLRFRNRRFTAEICDICIVWYTPAQHRDGEPFFEGDLFRDIVRENRALVDKRAPDAQMWVLGQTYTQLQHRHQLRMPSPDEMELMFAMAQHERAGGFLWYPWLHSSYDQVLSDPDAELQRKAVRQIYERHIMESPVQ